MSSVPLKNLYFPCSAPPMEHGSAAVLCRSAAAFKGFLLRFSCGKRGFAPHDYRSRGFAPLLRGRPPRPRALPEPTRGKPLDPFTGFARTHPCGRQGKGQALSQFKRIWVAKHVKGLSRHNGAPAPLFHVPLDMRRAYSINEGCIISPSHTFIIRDHFHPNLFTHACPQGHTNK